VTYHCGLVPALHLLEAIEFPIFRPGLFRRVIQLRAQYVVTACVSVDSGCARASSLASTGGLCPCATCTPHCPPLYLMPLRRARTFPCIVIVNSKSRLCASRVAHRQTACTPTDMSAGDIPLYTLVNFIRVAHAVGVPWPTLAPPFVHSHVLIAPEPCR